MNELGKSFKKKSDQNKSTNQRQNAACKQNNF